MHHEPITDRHLQAADAPPVVRLTILFLCAAMWTGALHSAAAQPAAACDTLLAQAHAAYVDQQFAEAVQQVDECLATGEAEREDLIAAYRLTALANIRLDQLGEARLAILHLLNTAPDYVPDPIADPPDYTVLVEVVRRQFQAQVGEPPQQRSWLRAHAGWVVSAAVAVTGGALAAILLGGGGGGGGGGDASGLPPPPGVPN